MEVSLFLVTLEETLEKVRLRAQTRKRVYEGM